MMLHLIRADLLKTRTRPMGWMMLALSVILVSLFIVLNRVVGGVPAEPVGWPTALFLGPRFIGQSVGGMMLIIFGASLPGTEYGYDTWKNLLTRRAGRGTFVVSKWVTLLLSALLALVILAPLSLALALAAGVARLDGPALPGPAMAVGAIGIQLVSLVVFGGVALFGAVAWRSTVAGIICGLTWMVADGLGAILPRMPEAARGLLYSVNEENLLRHLGMIPEAPHYPLGQSLLLSALYLALPLAGAALIFRRRDIVGPA